MSAIQQTPAETARAEATFDRLIAALYNLEEEARADLLLRFAETAEAAAETPKDYDRLWDESLRKPESVELLTEMAAKARQNAREGKSISLDEFFDRYPD